MRKPVELSAFATRAPSRGTRGPTGFVERLQGTILHEHWRIEFRRRYFTGRVAMQRSLEAFMQFYNEQRPHQGYRLRGRAPADLFWGATVAS